MSDTPPLWAATPEGLAACSRRVGPGVRRLDPAPAGPSALPAPLLAAREALRASGFALTEVDGTDLTSTAAALHAIGEALRMPPVTNLDALVDSLRDLAVWWPDDTRVALVWLACDVLEDADPDGFGELVDILSGGHQDAWQAPRTPGTTGDAADRVLRVVLAPRDAAGTDSAGTGAVGTGAAGAGAVGAPSRDGRATGGDAR